MMGRAFFYVRMDLLRELMGLPEDAVILAVWQSTAERAVGRIRVEVSSPDLPAAVGPTLPVINPVFRSEEGRQPVLRSWGDDIDEERIFDRLSAFEGVMEAELGTLEPVYDYFSPRFEIAHHEVANFLAQQELWQGRFTNRRWGEKLQVEFTHIVRKRVRYNLLKAEESEQETS